MHAELKSAGDGVANSGATQTGIEMLPARTRDGSITIAALADRYMAKYAGRDRSRPQRIGFWVARFADTRLVDLTDDAIFDALQDLATERGRFYAGKDVDGKPIYKAKRKALSGPSVNRYGAALAAMLSWAIKNRIAPSDWRHPCKSVERFPENKGRVRFLSDDERERLLAACKASKWPKLYLLVLLAITTGARRGELQRLRWADIDFERCVASVDETKNGDRRVLPLTPPVIEELRRFEGALGELLFPSSRRPDTPFNNVPAWQIAVKAAGLRDFRFHDLRHSCASYLAQSGAPLLQIAEVLGHRNLAITKRYAHLTIHHKAELVGKVLGGIR
jgi:integrase